MDEFNHIDLSKKINKFLKPTKKAFYKDFLEINKFFRHLLSCHLLYSWEYNSKIMKIYNKDEEECEYTKFRYFIYIPYLNIRIDTNYINANNISVVKNILGGDFSEKPIKVKYYDHITRTVIDGPTIVILNLPIESLLLEDDSSFFVDKFSNY